MQKVTIIGNLGKDPELRYTQNGDAVTNFSVATNYKKDGQDQTTWWRVSVWGKQAEPCNQYLNKGSKVYVEGRMQVDPQTGGPRVWTDQEGNPRSSLEISSTWVEFLGGQETQPGQAQSGQEQGSPQSNRSPNPDMEISEDEIPF